MSGKSLLIGGILILFCLRVTGGENKNLLDSKPRLIGGLSSRNTFIYGFNAPVLSLKIGGEFQSRFRMGAGFSYLKKSKFREGEDQRPFIYLKPVVTEMGVNDTIPSFFRLIYFSYFVDYVYYRKEGWEFSLPVQLGFGQAMYEYTSGDIKKREHESPVFVYEPSVSVQYKILKWLAAGGEIGYRFMLINHPVKGNHFNSPVYDLKLMILWAEVWKGISERRSK